MPDTATQWLSPREQHAWRSFLRLQGLLNARLNRALQLESGLSLSDFGILAVLSEHPAQRMRVLELARELQWEKSRVSHQVRRMTERGLISRSGCDEDRRGAFVELTADGRSAIEAAAPRHVDSVRANLFDALSTADVEELARISDLALAVIEKECGGETCD